MSPTSSEGAAGEDAAGEDAAGEDAAGEDLITFRDTAVMKQGQRLGLKRR
jgi:hypothetical protein